MLRISVHITLFLLIIFGLPKIISAQSFSFKHYTVEDGLNTSSVYYATQDLQGNMWFATEQGVCKFDGKTFTRYTINDGLSDNEVLFIKTDSKGRIWFLTLNGHLSFYLNGKFHNESNTLWLKKAFVGRSFNSCFEDSHGNLFFGGFGYNLTVLKSDSVVTVIPMKDFSYGNSFFENPDGSVNIYMADAPSYTYKEGKLIPLKLDHKCSRSNCFCLTNRYHLYMSYDGLIKKEGIHEEILLSNKELSPDFYVTSATEKPDSSILLTSRTGVLWFPKNVFDRSQAYKMLRGKKVLSHFADRENNFWFCTEGDGVYMLPDNQKNVLGYTALDGLHGEAINRVIKDSIGNVWLACENSSISEITASGIKNFVLDSFIIQNEKTRDVVVDRFGNVIAVGDGGVTHITKSGQEKYISAMWERGLSRVVVKSINKNYDNSISATMTDGVLKLEYDEKNEPKFFNIILGDTYYPAVRTYSHFFDRQNRLWVSNIRGFGVFENKEIHYFTDKDALLKSRIVNMGEMPDSTLVLSTEGYGVIFFKDGKIINHLTEKNGLSSSVCRRIFIKGDTIWVSTFLGLTMLRYNNNQFNNIHIYNVNNGLLSNAVRDIYDDGAKIYVATEKGLCILNETVDSKIIASPPPLHISNIVYSGTEYSSSDSLLEFGTINPLKINFSAVTFQNPGELKYRYRIPRLNSDWIETKNNSVEFSFTGSGKYIFEVQAKKVNSNWSKSASFAFLMVPPFYKTTWFYFLILTAVGFFIYYLTRFVTQQRFKRQLAIARQNEMIEHERMRIASDMHDDIGADLTQISIWTNILKASTRNEVVDKIVTSSNDVLQKVDSIIWALDSVHDHAEDLISYLRNYALNYLESSDIALAFETNHDMPDIKLTATQRRNIYLVFKELLHNTVKHSGATKVTVEINYTKPNLIIKYSDNGKGFDPAILGDGLGFTTLQQRMTEINSSFNFTTAPGNGFSAELKINA